MNRHEDEQGIPINATERTVEKPSEAAMSVAGEIDMTVGLDGEDYTEVARIIDAHAAAETAKLRAEVAEIKDEAHNERHESKAMRAMLDHAYSENAKKFYEGQSATDHGYVHVLAKLNHQVAALVESRRAWKRVHDARDNGFHHVGDAYAADARCRELGISLE